LLCMCRTKKMFPNCKIPRVILRVHTLQPAQAIWSQNKGIDNIGRHCNIRRTSFNQY
jgi:hypothetical protein